MYIHGLKLWLEKPILGWGPGSTPELIKITFPKDFPKFNDLHSVPIEILVRFGIIGSIIYWMMFFGVIWIGYSGYRKGFVPKDILIFSLGCALIYLIFGLFNFRLLNDDWRYYWFVVAALLTSWEMFPDPQREAILRSPSQ